MSKWREVRLGEVSAGTQYGYTESATHINTGVQFLRITDIVDYFIDWKSVPYCNITQKNLEKYCIKKNDLLIARTGATAGRFKTITASSIPSAVFASYLIRFKINEDQINLVFLNYYLQTTAYKGFVENYIGGSAQPNINAKTLSRFKLWIPDLTTQEKIADILSTYDKLIENNNRRIEILEKTAEEIYKEWFVRMRFPGYENTKFIKGIPEGWEVITLGQIVTFINGYAFSSVDYLEEGQYKIITIKNVKDGNIDTLNTVFLNGFPKNMNDNIKLNIGDMLLSLTGNVGRVGLVTEENLLLNQRVAKIEPINKKYSGFIYFLFRSDNNKSKLIDISTGAAQQNLSPAKALKIKFIGNYNKIIEFSSRVEPIIKCIIKIKIQNQNLIKQRDLLLPRLMNGTIEVK